MVSILFLYKSFYLFYIKVSNFKNKKQIIYPTKPNLLLIKESIRKVNGLKNQKA